MTDTKRDRGGFTILEIIVVLGIVMLLLLLVLPAFANVRESGWLAMCMSNQRQVGVFMAQDMNDNDTAFPSMWYVARFADQASLLDPRDEDPVVLPAALLGTAQDVYMSYAINPEYYLYHVAFDNLADPAGTLMLYDGFGGGLDGYESDDSGGSGFDGDALINGNKLTITHLPPGNNEKAQVVNIGVSALKGHVGDEDRNHFDLFGTWAVGGKVNVPYALRGDFERRHWRAATHGSATFADNHVEALTEVRDDMFIVP